MPPSNRSVDAPLAGARDRKSIASQAGVIEADDPGDGLVIEFIPAGKVWVG
jgi:hypothetical protein